MDKNEKDSTDDASIRPVSSLLSHFEGLNHLKPQSKSATQPNGSSTPSRPTEVNDRSETPPLAGRASLDLPRPDSQWGSSGIKQGGQSYNPPRSGFEGLLNRGSPGRRNNRPMSMSLQSSPQLGPTLTVESPRSPPRSFGQRLDSARPSLPTESIDSSPALRPSSRSTFNQNGHAATRSTSPTVGSRDAGLSHRDGPENSNFKRSPTAPPINRAEKPKIPPKGSKLLNLEGLGRAPPSQGAPRRATSSEDRVSPFSTPPSSPERPTASVTNRKPGKLIIPESNPNHSSTLPKSPQPKTPARSSSRGPAPEIVRETKPKFNTVTGRHAPSATPQAENPRRPGILNINSKISDDPEDRPGLPPRGAAPDPGNGLSQNSGNRADTRTVVDRPRSSLDVRSWPPESEKSPSRRSTAEPGARAPPPPPARRDASRRLANDSQPSTPQTATPPPFSRETKYTTSKPAARQPLQPPQPARDESDDVELPMDDAPISRTDYPDASQANRRPPFSKSGPHEIPTRYDTRCFDVCGQYACTTGYITKIWDLVTGEQVVLLSHGETVKVLSIAFKPGKDLESEGKRLWLGTSSGDLLEVDIETKSIVSSRTSPSRKEIIKIYRHKRELWTLDDEGRLLMWPPDESGTPNLQYSYSSPYDRVAKGHTFSMIVGDTLWLATGKEVRIYRLTCSNDADFQLLKKPLGQSHTGEVTSGATTTKNGGRVYLGHADGKVTIYSTKDYSCLGSVSVSVYKINCLAFVGDYLWAAYKTGMIYVYDTSTNPWIVKKDWHAHDNPVCGLLLDQSSIWTMNRLQVTSLGTDNFIRLWDGMLEDDWIETRMEERDVDYCDFREIKASIITWNAGAAIPSSLRDSSFLSDAIHPESPPDILVFGFQELVDLEDKKITAKSLLKSSKKKDKDEKEHMSRQYRVWKDHLVTSVNDLMPHDQPYTLLHTAHLVGLFTCILVKQKEKDRIRNAHATEVKRGMGGLHGNKGALIFRFVIDDSSLCFINCHLAAGQTHTAHRNNDIAAILESETLPVERNMTTRTDHFVGGGDGTMVLDHEICIINGDLNYRIDSIPRNTVIEAVKARNLPKLLDRDQLLASRRKNPGFRLRSFIEAPITFAPTYKYNVGTDEYDTSEKRRAPAWCDRILYRGVGRIKQLEYRRHEIQVSDHRPVSGTFKLRVKTITPKKRMATWESCQGEFVEEKRRLATEASVDYLVTILGIKHQEARALISSSGTS
ncbi:hypothetical protein FQN54_009842 [Arachnomyces sp. PD_36]|nr:hypothetical protein FQN54_009842 [Arachnomyces sp. PD_36]